MVAVAFKFRLFILLSFFSIGILGFQQEAFAQKEIEKKKTEENENVFLHPKKFYKKFMPGLKVKPNPLDTAYIKTYPNYLSVSMRVVSPSIRLDISPSGSDAGASKFRTSIGDIIGFNASYRFVSAGFAFLLKSGAQTNDDYAKSSYRTVTVKYANRAWSLQYKFLKFKGLTDINQEEYIKRMDIINKEYHFEGVYNPGWRKYSYIAPFTNSQRQMKSRAGILVKTGIFYTQLFGDSALIAPSQQPYFEGFDDAGVIRSLSIKLAPGAGGHFVFFKRYYISMSVFPSYDLYLYKYLKHPDEKKDGYQTFVFVFDGEASLGYQSPRFFAGLRYEFERKPASLHSIRTNNVYTYIGLEVGYRFNTPKVVKKVYKETMPPGM